MYTNQMVLYEDTVGFGSSGSVVATPLFFVAALLAGMTSASLKASLFSE